MPVEYQILGLDSIHARVRYPKASIEHFQSLYNWASAGQHTFFDTDLTVEILHNRNQDMYHEIHFIYDTFNPIEDQGFVGYITLLFQLKTKVNCKKLKLL